MDEKIELMYRQPGSDYHQNIVEVLDEIIFRLDEIESRLDSLDHQTDILNTDSFGGTD